ncbi:MAG TPA: Flp family type IVb pilin [Nocardioides sp.]|uniref:Flp family type IVb pilin n=1 Tax=Nocardioides sp. TaxID=35761 RepID=UPI002ED87E2C
MSASRAGRRREQRGASAVEYGLLIAGIAALLVVILFAFGDSIRDVLFEDTCEVMKTHSAIPDSDCTDTN